MTSSTPTQFRPFINGAWSEDNGHASDWPVMNPATGDLLGLAVTSGLDVVDRAAKAASTAFESWSKRTPAERSRLLLRLAQRLEDHAGVVAQLESANVGKPAERSQSELAFCIDYLRFVAGAARTLEGRAMAEYAPDRTSAIRRDPLGVIAGIAPWNYPLMMALWKLAPAIAVGNTAVIKPSELTPLSALKLAEIAGEVLPPGVLNVVTGDGVTTGDALVRHPLVKMVSVTGDVETGKKIARAAADTLKRLHLELGGNAPVLVFADADLDAAVAKIRTSAYRNAGQDCTAGSRVIVEADVYDDFLARFVPAVEELRVGDPASETVDVGPVISEGQQRRE
jgi:acyl-CoA reductase-like NAD-dependent aldehyde dehydrogenase